MRKKKNRDKQKRRKREVEVSQGMKHECHGVLQLGEFGMMESDDVD